MSQVGHAEMCQSARVHPKDVFELLGLAQLISAEDMVLRARMTETDEEDSSDNFDLDDLTEVDGYDFDNEGTAEL